MQINAITQRQNTTIVIASYLKNKQITTTKNRTNNKTFFYVGLDHFNENGLTELPAVSAKILNKLKCLPKFFFDNI